MAKTYEEYIKEQSEKMKKGWTDAYGNWVDADKYADPEWRKEYFARNEQLRNKQVDDAIARGELAVKDGKVYQGGKVIHEKPKTAYKPGAISYAGGNPRFDERTGEYREINDLFDQIEKSRLAALRAARDRAIGELNMQKSSLNPMYQNYRNQTDAQHMQAAQRLRELMAAQGLTNSGDNVSANVALQASRQNALNDLNLQQQQAVNQINQQIANVNNSGDEQAILAEINAARANALMDAQRRAEEMALRQQQLAYQQERDRIMDDRWQQQFDLQRLQDDRNFQYQMLRDQIADERYKAEFDEDVRRFGLNYALDKARLNNQISQQKIDNALAQARLQQDQQEAMLRELYRQWEMTGRAPAGIPGVAAGTPLYDPVLNRQAQNNPLSGFHNFLSGLGGALMQYQTRVNGTAGTPLPTKINPDDEILRRYLGR